MQREEVVHTPVSQRQRQVDFCEYRSSMIYRASSFQDSQGYAKRPCYEKQNRGMERRKGEEEGPGAGAGGVEAAENSSFMIPVVGREVRSHHLQKTGKK